MDAAHYKSGTNRVQIPDAVDQASLFEQTTRLQELLKMRGWKLAVAESCTGGMLAAQLTTLPGSSTVFFGGVVAYANSVKQTILDVPEHTIRTHGSVSEACAIAMVDGIVQRTGADCGIAITGVAGPSGGSVEKPVGTVWIAITTPIGQIAEHQMFTGSREQIRAQAVLSAIYLLVACLSRG